MERRRPDILNDILKRGIVAVIRLPDATVVRKVVDALVAGGVTCIEITTSVPGAAELIRSLVADASPDLLLGAGTVIGREQALEVLDAGAQFLVSPVMDIAVIEAAHEFDCPAMPGAYTPSEIHQAWEAGADVVKVFPADQLGVPYFRAVLAPLPHVLLMPTGGVTLTNAGDWLRAGACAVGVGGALVDKEKVLRGDFAGLTANAKVISANVSAAHAELYGTGGPRMAAP
jgi:2-dehydro-3-deoxyphosphogluconate aldolase/(4S)-4-hydroxy-2-oxoglutarate aldolase